jgi:hypothetical protein
MKLLLILLLVVPGNAIAPLQTTTDSLPRDVDQPQNEVIQLRSALSEMNETMCKLTSNQRTHRDILLLGRE